MSSAERAACDFYTSSVSSIVSIGNLSSVERADNGCYTCCVSSIELMTIPVTLGTCQAWTGPAVAVKHAESSIEQASILVVLGLCPAWSGLAVVAIYVALPVYMSQATSSIGKVSTVEWAGSGCYTCSVSNIEQATTPVVLETCPAWGGPAVVVHLLQY